MTPLVRTFTIAATIFLPIIFVVVMILNGVSNSPDLGIFVSTMQQASDLFRLDITPAGWAFSIWSVIYIFQAAFIVSLLVNLCRKTQGCQEESCGPPTRIFERPGLFPLASIISYGASYIFTICWLFFFDRATINRPLLALAMVSLWLVVIVLGISLFFSYRRLGQEESWLRSMKCGRIEIWVTRILAHNGISMYAAWCCVAAPLNTAMVMAHMGNLTVQTAGTVSLAIVAVEMVVYAGLDALLLDRWTRYTVTPHCVLVWAFSASLVKNYRAGAVNSVFTLVLLAIAGVALVVKVVLMLVRHFKSGSVVSVGITSKLDNVSVASGSTVDVKKPIA